MRPCSCLGWNQTKLAQAGMPPTTDDQVVVNRYPERRGYLDDVDGHANIGRRGCRITGRMIMHKD
jgi:hypothetical protein